MSSERRIIHDENVEYLVEKLTEDDIPEESITSMIAKADEVYSKSMNYLNNDENTEGLILGKVQSGKTNNVMMSSAVAVDNNICFFVFFTTDSNWLYNQSLTRIMESIPGLHLVSKVSLITQL
ncbi:hypothetical protein [Clostridium psychrophilum]|uniref:hypothetical protein n=1 Tax=Clostridium psychrophilum TaxID=132926 RepID=UPI001C0CDE34|nr:hypothetical protein [Clostridium psychrophilum]MBU3181179.1 hypothetical protein [Clostridium psychrophilum]